MKLFSLLLRLICLLNIACVVALLSCNEETTKPPPIVEEEPEDTTTSHDFQFQYFFFGEMDSNLRDVCIVNDTCIWAVGIIHARDSLGKLDDYNAIRWNGKEWQLTRIPVLLCGGTSTHPFQLDYVSAINEQDVWFGAGGEIVRWNGVQFRSDCELWSLEWQWNRGGSRKVWRTKAEAYLVGTRGLIVYWDGREYRKIESGTTLDFFDIYGTVDSTTGGTSIFAVASNPQFIVETKVVKIEKDKVTELSNIGLPWSSNGVWFQHGKSIYIVGDGIYHKKFKEVAHENKWNHEADLTTYYSEAVRGTKHNDIFVCGSYGAFLHFNGKSWKTYWEVKNNFPSGSLVRIAYRSNLVCAVGYQGRAAAIVVGRRR